MMRQRLLMPKVVISLARIPKFDKITYNAKDGLRIGAGARHRDIELSPAVQKHYPLLHETFRKVAQPRIRNMGTVGGNLAAGDPLTDPGASLIALDAEVTLSSSKGQRRLRLDEFFIDYYQTALEPGELLTEIHVPPPQRPGWSHIKFTPRSVEDFATVGVAITLQTKNGTCEDVRLGLNSVASTIVRAKKAEEVLRGKTDRRCHSPRNGRSCLYRMRSHGRQPRFRRLQARNGQSLGAPRRPRSAPTRQLTPQCSTLEADKEFSGLQFIARAPRTAL